MLFGWNHATVGQKGQDLHQAFKEGAFGSEIYKGLEPDLKSGDVVVSKHWSGSSFQNTDLDYQLRQRDITHLVIAGLAAETCVETTARYAFEMGYNVTVLKDATAWFDKDIHKVSADMIWPRVTNRVLTVEEWTATLN